jgi:NIMA (never in mitosis gene a)-related kinase
MENYEIINNIGKGSFGVVSKVRRKSDGRTLVWKELNYGRMSEKEKQQLVAEVNILRELRHPHIVRYYDRIIDKKLTKIYIIMEYCEGGDMGTLIKKCKKEKDYIAEDVIWKVFTQILLALHECHTKKTGKILHRDLKPANIFLDGQNNIKLGDFGLSRVMNEQSMFAYTHVGTPYYMSPEQINESKYNEKSDIWSAGCLLYEIAALRPPFEASNHLSLAIKIKAGKFERLPIRYSDDLQKLIEVMLCVNPDRRPSVEDLLTIPQVAMRIKEKRVRDRLSQIKQTETDLQKKEEDLKQLEGSLSKKEEELRQLEQRIQGMEKKTAAATTQFSMYSQLEDQEDSGNSYGNDENAMPDTLSTQPSSRLTRRFETWRERLGDTDFESNNGSSTKKLRNPLSNMKSMTFNVRNQASDNTTRSFAPTNKRIFGDITNYIK